NLIFQSDDGCEKIYRFVFSQWKESYSCNTIYSVDMTVRDCTNPACQPCSPSTFNLSVGAGGTVSGNACSKTVSGPGTFQSTPPECACSVSVTAVSDIAELYPLWTCDGEYCSIIGDSVSCSIGDEDGGETDHCSVEFITASQRDKTRCIDSLGLEDGDTVGNWTWKSLGTDEQCRGLYVLSYIVKSGGVSRSETVQFTAASPRSDCTPGVSYINIGGDSTSGYGLDSICEFLNERFDADGDLSTGDDDTGDDDIDWPDIVSPNDLEPILPPPDLDESTPPLEEPPLGENGETCDTCLYNLMNPISQNVEALNNNIIDVSKQLSDMQTLSKSQSDATNDKLSSVVHNTSSIDNSVTSMDQNLSSKLDDVSVALDDVATAISDKEFNFDDSSIVSAIENNVWTEENEVNAMTTYNDQVTPEVQSVANSEQSKIDNSVGSNVADYASKNDVDTDFSQVSELDSDINQNKETINTGLSQIKEVVDDIASDKVGVRLIDPECSLSLSLSLGSESDNIDLNFCNWADVLDTMGLALLGLVYIRAFIIQLEALGD
ncbi:MAG: hypothetical protein AB7S75_07755, partial [Desulfococcaceae bacterium]